MIISLLDELFKRNLFVKLLGHNNDLIANQAPHAAIFFIRSLVIIMFGLEIIHFLHNKYLENQTSKILYHNGPLIVADSISLLVIFIFIHQGSHNGIYRLKESSQVLSSDVIIRVSKYLDLAKFFIVATK